MPHQCVKCGTLYDDGSNEILQGCKCGGKLFFYIKKQSLERKEELIRLTKKEKEQIEEDIYDIIGNQIDKEKTIVLDIETINILKPGKYEIDLVNLFKKQPLIYKLEEGKYMIDIIESFKKMRDAHDEK
ncbi:MAG: Zn-ribbon domain-containing protein [Nanoarchaeota archaeon]|nr:Zn-ribbon domain-containing protein [Nanoarchaeota archaeon]MBU1854538.1 Zn-ribbon domain-containing protein [Nanoarchaeota archaeon]